MVTLFVFFVGQTIVRDDSSKQRDTVAIVVLTFGIRMASVVSVASVTSVTMSVTMTMAVLSTSFHAVASKPLQRV